MGAYALSRYSQSSRASQTQDLQLGKEGISDSHAIASFARFPIDLRLQLKLATV